jgi:hypothetical protein
MHAAVCIVAQYLHNSGSTDSIDSMPAVSISESSIGFDQYPKTNMS